MKKIMLAFVLAVTFIGISNSIYFDRFTTYCRQSSDCMLSSTGCCACSTQIAVNKFGSFYYNLLNKRNCDPNPICTKDICIMKTVSCINNRCELGYGIDQIEGVLL